MGLKSFKPKTPGTRWRTGYDFSEITKSTPEKSLTAPIKKSGGRNVYGRITVRGQGGGHKKRYRIIDFKRDKYDAPAKVIAIEYDPNRTCRIALVQYQDGEKRYILCPVGLKVNDEVLSGKSVEIKVGNAMPLESIPPGIPIHNVELEKGRGGILARSAGNACNILAKEGVFAHLRLPSGEVRLVKSDCFATIGQIGNIEHDTMMIGKAGRARHMGIMPLSRAVAKNPHDHPMGGGEGKSSGGRHPCTPWGKPTKGYKTRKTKNSDKYIIKRRGNK